MNLSRSFQFLLAGCLAMALSENLLGGTERFEYIFGSSALARVPGLPAVPVYDNKIYRSDGTPLTGWADRFGVRKASLVLSLEINPFTTAPVATSYEAQLGIQLRFRRLGSATDSLRNITLRVTFQPGVGAVYKAVDAFS